MKLWSDSRRNPEQKCGWEHLAQACEGGTAGRTLGGWDELGITPVGTGRLAKTWYDW